MLLTCAHDIELVKQQLWKGGGGSEAIFLTSFPIFGAILKGKAFFEESVSTILKLVVVSLLISPQTKIHTLLIDSPQTKRLTLLINLNVLQQIFSLNNSSSLLRFLQWHCPAAFPGLAIDNTASRYSAGLQSHVPFFPQRKRHDHLRRVHKALHEISHQLSHRQHGRGRPLHDIQRLALFDRVHVRDESLVRWHYGHDHV